MTATTAAAAATVANSICDEREKKEQAFIFFVYATGNLKSLYS